MKKSLKLALSAMLVLSTVACGNSSDTSAPKEEKSKPVNATNLIMYQFDKDNMDVDFEDADEAYTVDDLKKQGEVTQKTENGLTFFVVEDEDYVSYYFSKDDYKNRLTEVDVTLDNFDEYFELKEEEIWNEDGVVFNKYFQLKDQYLFAMVDYDHLYDNTADAVCRPIDYISSIDVKNKTYDWGIYDVRHEESEIWIDFSETDDYVYKNTIVSTYPDNYIEDNGDGTANGVAHEDVKLTNVSIKFYYLKTK